MPRDERAYLADIIESCNAITGAVSGLNLTDYETNRLMELATDTNKRG